MKINEIAFTGYPVTDIARARDFYENSLKLTPSDVWEMDGMSWIEYDIAGGILAITDMASEWKPGSQGGTIALEVEDFEEAHKWLKERGANIVAEPLVTGVCKMLFIQDPDGNALTIHKRNPDRD